MSDKIYPPTANKLQELRAIGRIPFSKVSLVCFNVISTIAGLWIFLPNNFLPDLSALSLNHVEVKSSLDFYKPFLLYFAKVSSLIMLLSVAARLYMSKFLFLPLGKYKRGILAEAKSKYAEKQKFLISLTVLLTTSAFLFVAAKKSSAVIFGINTFTANLLLPYLYIIGVVLAISGIFCSYLSHHRFLESERMSKAEILAELRELEGNRQSAAVRREE